MTKEKLKRKGKIVVFAGAVIAFAVASSKLKLTNRDDRGPSATRNEETEDLGHWVDDKLGNDVPWTTTTDCDTYGEALSGVLDTFLLDGPYKKQTEEDIKNGAKKEASRIAIKEDEIMQQFDEQQNKILKTLIEAKNKKPESFEAALKKTFGYYSISKSDQDDCIDKFNGIVDYIFNGTQVEGIKYDDLNKQTRIHILDTALTEYTVISSKMGQKLDDETINNKLNNLLGYLLRTSDDAKTDEYHQYKESLTKVKTR